MKSRWILFYDGACPLCIKTKSKITNLLDKNIKLSLVDLNSTIAKSKGYDLSQVVLEIGPDVFRGKEAWLKIISHTKYAWFSHILLRPCFIVFYHLVNKNRRFFNRFF